MKYFFALMAVLIALPAYSAERTPIAVTDFTAERSTQLARGPAGSAG